MSESPRRRSRAARVLLRSAAVVAAAAAAFWLWPKAPTPAEAAAAGVDVNWRPREYPDWVPKWAVKRLPARSPQPLGVTVHADPWPAGADRLIGRLGPVAAFDLSRSGVPDASLLRILDRHPVKRLNLDDTPLSAAAVRGAAAALSRTGGRLQADARGTTDAELAAVAADHPTGVLDRTLMIRAARRFVGGRADWRLRTADGTRAAFAQDANPLWLSGQFDIRLRFHPKAGGGRAAVSEETALLISVLANPAGVTTENLDLAFPADRPPACGPFWLRNATPRVLPGLRRCTTASLSDWRFGDEPLRSLDAPAMTALYVEAGDGEPLDGSFLSAARLDACQTLKVVGTAGPDAGPVPLPGLTPPPLSASVWLESVALGGDALRRLLPPRTDQIVLADLPCVTPGGLAAALEGRAVRTLRIGPGVRLDAASLRAAVSDSARTRTGPETLHIDQSCLPPEAAVREAVDAVAGRPTRLVRVHAGGDPSAAATALLRLPGSRAE